MLQQLHRSLLAAAAGSSLPTGFSRPKPAATKHCTWKQEPEIQPPPPSAQDGKTRKKKMNPRFFNAHNTTCDRKQMTQEEEEDDDGDEIFWQMQWQRSNKTQTENLRNVLQIHSLWMEERREQKSKSTKSQWMKKVGKASKGTVAAAVFLEDWRRRRSKWWNRKSRARNLQTTTTTPDNDDKPNSLILRIWRTSRKRKKRNTTKAPWLQYYLKKSRMTRDRKDSSEERIMT
jgi:hypothetical protein